MRQRIPQDRDLRELPQARQRPPAKPLDDYVRKKPERNDTIVAAYRSGSSTLRDIADFFGLHYSRISKIIQAADSAQHREKSLSTSCALGAGACSTDRTISIQMARGGGTRAAIQSSMPITHPRLRSAGDEPGAGLVQRQTAANQVSGIT